MSTLTAIVDGVATLIVLGLVGRAVVRLRKHPEKNHAALVPAWERRLTTAVGVPVLAVALSSMADGPLDVGYVSIQILLAGLTLLVYPEFAPRGGT